MEREVEGSHSTLQRTSYHIIQSMPQKAVFIGVIRHFCESALVRTL